MEKIINEVPWGLDLSSLFHLIYFNDEPKITDNDAKILQFAVIYIYVAYLHIIKRKFKQYNQNTV